MDDGPASAMAVEGNRLLTGHANGTVVLWGLGNERRRSPPSSATTPKSGPSHFLAAPNGSRPQVMIGKLQSGRRPRPVDHSASLMLTTARCNPLLRPIRIETILISGSADKTLKSGTSRHSIPVAPNRGHRDYVSAVAMSPGGKDIATASIDGNVRIWSTRSSRLTGHCQVTTGVPALSPSLHPETSLRPAAPTARCVCGISSRSRTPRTLPSHAGDIAAVAFHPTVFTSRQPVTMGSYACGTIHFSSRSRIDRTYLQYRLLPVTAAPREIDMKVVMVKLV